MSSGATVDMSEVDRELKRIHALVSDFSPIMPAVAEVLVAAVNDKWMSAGNGSWAPLAPSTLYKRRMRGKGAQILQDTGRAIASVQADSGPDWAQAATDVSYMVYHVSDGARSKIPLRNPFDVEEEVMDDVLMTISNWIVGET